MAMASDTLSISKDLRAAGFNEQQADALAMHMAAVPANLASREDLGRFRARQNSSSWLRHANRSAGPTRLIS